MYSNYSFSNAVMNCCSEAFHIVIASPCCTSVTESIPEITLQSIWNICTSNESIYLTEYSIRQLQCHCAFRNRFNYVKLPIFFRLVLKSLFFTYLCSAINKLHFIKFPRRSVSATIPSMTASFQLPRSATCRRKNREIASPDALHLRI